jgi:predicted nucleic-acid-binding protein
VIALDTNVLVRLLVEDDREQARRAVTLLRGVADRGEQAFVADVVICELAWVLTSAYGFGKPDVLRALRGLLGAAELAFRDAAGLERALTAFEAGRGDLADHVIREQALAAGCEAVATFDRALHRVPGFVAA